MKRKITSIALSTVMTGSMLFTPVASAQDVTPNKIVVNENVQVQSTEEENLTDEVKEDAKIIKEEAKVEEVEKEEAKQEEAKVKEVEKEEVKQEEAKVEEVEKEEVKQEEAKVEEVEKEAVKQEEAKAEEVEKEDIKQEEVKVEAKLKEKSGLEFIEVKNSGKKSANLDGAIEFFEENKDTFKIDNSRDEFEMISKNTDKLGNIHIKLQQTYKGNPLYGKEYIVHFNDEGSIYAVNGKIDNEIYNKVPRRTRRSLGIDETMAIEAAKTELGAEKLINEPEVNKYLYDLDGRYISAYEVRLIVAEPELGD